MSYKEDMKEPSLILEQIIKLLESVHESSWVRTLKIFLNDCRCVENEEEANSARKQILHIYGGMGSFNDLVLSSGDKILPEHKEFYKLKHILFETIRDQL